MGPLISSIDGAYTGIRALSIADEVNVDKCGLGGDIRLLNRRETFVTDAIDEGGHGEMNCV
jgi:hypothetical protein